MNRDQIDTRDEPSGTGAYPLDDSDPEAITVVDGTDVVGANHRPDDAHLSAAEVARLRTLFNDGSLEDETSRIKWFLLGFLAALLALVIAAIAFLAISDDDNDGDVDLEVPTVDVDIDG